VFNDAAQPVVLRREAHSAALTTGVLPAQSLQSRFVVPLGAADRVALALMMLSEAGFAPRAAAER
jgi:hypothetical protein